jgi:uncharacterized membrane protein YfcA
VSDAAAPAAPAAERTVPVARAAAVGVAAGLLGGLFGVGGGLIIVPGLMSWAAMERRLAHGTSLAATLPIAIASLATYLAQGNVDWPVAACLAVGAIAGAIAGTQLLQVIPKRLLIVVFAVTVLATASRLLIGTDTGGRTDLTVGMGLLFVVIGFLTGTLAGLLGIGGGVIMVPAMVVILGMPPVVAKGTSVAVIVPTSIMGTIRNRKHANADLRAAAIVGLFGAATAVLGATISDRLDDDIANAMFAVLLVFVAVTQLLSLRTPSTPAEPEPTQERR